VYEERRKTKGVYGYKNKTQKTSLSVMKKEEKPTGSMNTNRQTLQTALSVMKKEEKTRRVYGKSKP
jgi:hypothetical protein